MDIDLVLRNATIVNANGRLNGSIGVNDGKIVVLGSSEAMPNAKRTVDLAEKPVLPGVIDPHVHLGFGSPIEEEWITETGPAVRGGVTTISNYLWHEDSYVAHLADDIRTGEELSFTNFAFEPLMINRRHNEEIGQLGLRGIGGYKWFTCYKGDEGEPWGIDACDDGVIYDGFRRVASLGPSAFVKVHVEDIELIKEIRAPILESGRADLVAFADSRPGIAEASDMLKMIYLARKAGVRIVILHVSSAEGASVLGREFRDDGSASAILGETCPHYLTLTKDSEVGVVAKVIPPIQGEADQSVLWDAIRSGTIRSIGSDHAATPASDKVGNVWQVKQGFPGSPLILPLLLSEGVRKRGLSLEQLVAITSFHNAVWYGHFPQKGQIAVGADADLVVLDLEKRATITRDLVGWSADYCLHEGVEVQGWPVLTVLGGRIVAEDGDLVVKPGVGTYLPAREVASYCLAR